MTGYAARTAALAVAYVGIFWASAQSFGPYLFLLPPIAVGALWLVAQGRFGQRRLDLVALATAGAVGATLTGAGLLLSFAVAAWAVLPPLAFAELLHRWLPGYWQGHGDRFRRSRATLAKLTGAAAATATAGVVLHEVTSPGTGGAAMLVQLLRDTAVIVGLTLAARALRRPRHERSLSVVR